MLLNHQIKRDTLNVELTLISSKSFDVAQRCLVYRVSTFIDTHSRFPVAGISLLLIPLHNENFDLLDPC